MTACCGLVDIALQIENVLEKWESYMFIGLLALKTSVVPKKYIANLLRFNLPRSVFNVNSALSCIWILLRNVRIETVRKTARVGSLAVGDIQVNSQIHQPCVLRCFCPFCFSTHNH